MKRMNYLFVAVVVYLGVILLSCGTIPPAEIQGESNNTAKVYFIMPGSGTTISGFGSLTLGTKFTLWDSDTFISYIGGKDFLILNFEAGPHFFMASGGNWSIVKAELAAGKSYFFKLTTLPGFSKPNVVLESLDPNNPEIQNYLESSKEITPNGKVSSSLIKKATEELSAVQNG